MPEKLKLSKLQQLFADIASQSCEVQKHSVREFFAQWSHPPGIKRYEQVDDIVLIGMKIPGSVG